MWALVVAGEWLAVFVFWQISVARLGLVNPAFLPTPLTILKTGLAMLSGTTTFYGSTLWENVQFSAVNWLVGYALAALLGVTTGLAIGSFLPAHRLLVPLAWSLYATPLVAIRPMTVVWFGFGAAPLIFLIFISALFPILLNTAAGVRTVDPSLVHAARVFGANRMHVYRNIILPGTLPYITVGMRLAIPASLIGLIVGEHVGSPRGIGAVITIATSSFRADQALAAIVLLVVVSVSLVRVAEWLHRRLAPWYHDAARDS